MLLADERSQHGRGRQRLEGVPLPRVFGGRSLCSPHYSGPMVDSRQNDPSADMYIAARPSEPSWSRSRRVSVLVVHRPAANCQRGIRAGSCVSRHELPRALSTPARPRI